jgi:hypothetical protein
VAYDRDTAERVRRLLADLTTRPWPLTRTAAARTSSVPAAFQAPPMRSPGPSGTRPGRQVRAIAFSSPHVWCRIIDTAIGGLDVDGYHVGARPWLVAGRQSDLVPPSRQRNR